MKVANLKPPSSSTTIAPPDIPRFGSKYATAGSPGTFGAAVSPGAKDAESPARRGRIDPETGAVLSPQPAPPSSERRSRVDPGSQVAGSASPVRSPVEAVPEAGESPRRREKLELESPREGGDASSGPVPGSGVLGGILDDDDSTDTASRGYRVAEPSPGASEQGSKAGSRTGSQRDSPAMKVVDPAASLSNLAGSGEGPAESTPSEVGDLVSDHELGLGSSDEEILEGPEGDDEVQDLSSRKLSARDRDIMKASKKLS